MEGVERWLTGGVREKDTASVGHRRGFGGSAAVGVSGTGYGAGSAGSSRGGSRDEEGGVQSGAGERSRSG